MEEHVQLVRQMWEKLLKDEFHQTRLDYLGYRILGAGVEMDPNKVKAVLEW